MANCKKAFRKLYDYLNSDVEKLDPEQMEKHLNLCKSVCSYCKFSEEVTRAMQTSCFSKKASPELKSKILKDIAPSG